MESWRIAKKKNVCVLCKPMRFVWEKIKFFFFFYIFIPETRKRVKTYLVIRQNTTKHQPYQETER